MFCRIKIVTPLQIYRINKHLIETHRFLCRNKFKIYTFICIQELWVNIVDLKIDDILGLINLNIEQQYLFTVRTRQTRLCLCDDNQW